MTLQWLLDTCVVSELFRPTPEPAVRAWLDRHGQACALAAVSFGEISHGIEVLPAGPRRNALSAWARGLQERFAERTLPTNAEVWNTYGRLRASLRAIGRPQDSHDLLIASTAAAHGLTLVTRNTRHFEDTGVPLCNPWTPITPSTP